MTLSTVFAQQIPTNAFEISSSHGPGCTPCECGEFWGCVFENFTRPYGGLYIIRDISSLLLIFCWFILLFLVPLLLILLYGYKILIIKKLLKGIFIFILLVIILYFASKLLLKILPSDSRTKPTVINDLRAMKSRQSKIIPLEISPDGWKQVKVYEDLFLYIPNDWDQIQSDANEPNKISFGSSNMTLLTIETGDNLFDERINDYKKSGRSITKEKVSINGEYFDRYDLGEKINGDLLSLGFKNWHVKLNGREYIIYQPHEMIMLDNTIPYEKLYGTIVSTIEPE